MSESLGVPYGLPHLLYLRDSSPASIHTPEPTVTVEAAEVVETVETVASEIDAKGGDNMVVAYKPKRKRKSPVTDKIIAFLSEHPNTEFSLDQIAMNANLSRKTTQNSMSRLRQEGKASYGTNRGFWKWNADGTPLEPRSTRRAPIKRSTANVSKNGTTPTAIGERDVLEVLRVRVGGEIVLIDTNGDFWVGRKVDV
jgi:predicted transcriptional regulator